MSRSPRALPDRFIDIGLTEKLGREVVKIEVLPLQPGQCVHLRFESAASPLRQGVWLATKGVLRVGEVAASQMEIWADTAPPHSEVACEASDGFLRLYNFWRTRGSAIAPGVVVSLLDNSGMIVEELPGGWRRYSCSHSAPEADFGRLVFRIAII